MCWTTTNDSDKEGHMSSQRFWETNFFLQVSLQIEVGLLQQIEMLAWQSHSKAVKEIPAKYNQSVQKVLHKCAISVQLCKGSGIWIPEVERAGSRVDTQNASKYSVEFMFYPTDIHFVTLDQRLEGQTRHDGMQNPCDKLWQAVISLKFMPTMSAREFSSVDMSLPAFFVASVLCGSLS